MISVSYCSWNVLLGPPRVSDRSELTAAVVIHKPLQKNLLCHVWAALATEHFTPVIFVFVLLSVCLFFDTEFLWERALAVLDSVWRLC